MKKWHLFRELEKERKKLNKLIDEALEKGTPIFQTEEVMEQSKKVNELVDTLQKELSKMKNYRER